MDPVAFFPEEVADDIFHHLEGKDIKESTLVNSDWNGYVGSSSKCMQKLRIDTKTRSQAELQNILEVIKNRHHQNVIIHDMYWVDELIITKFHSWKAIQINSCEFTLPAFQQLLKAMSPAVEELVLDSVKIVSIETEDKPKAFYKPETVCDRVTFKNLKTLKIYGDGHNFSLDFFDAPALANLHLQGNLIHKDYTTNAVNEYLLRLRKLKKLFMDSQWFNLIYEFNYDGREYPFELEVFSVTRGPVVVRFLYYESNFEKFMVKQSKTIRKFSLCDFVGLDAMKIIYEMPFLKAFTVCDCPWFIFANIRAYKHFVHSVEFLDIALLDTSSEKKMEHILLIFPNLEYLRIREVNEQIANLILENLHHVKTIRVVHNPETKIVKLLPNIKWV